jgi:hypothetical protein
MKGMNLAFGLLLAGVVSVAPVAHAASKPRFNARGNIVIVDRYNNRLIELDPETHTIVWEYDHSDAKSGTEWLVGPCDAERFRSRTLIVAAGLPPGVNSDYPDGYVDDRVFEIDRKGKIKWQYGQTGVSGAGPNQLNHPVSAVYTRHNSVLIADQGNHRVVHLQRKGKGAKIAWQYGTTGVSGNDTNQLDSPSCVQRLGSGNYLIADTGNNRVIEVTRKGELVWQYGQPEDTDVLNGPTYACHLHGDNILITDSGNNRILVVDRTGSNLFTYVTSARPDSVAEPQPSHAVQLKSGNFLVADQFNHQVIEVDGSGNIVYSHGTIATPGDGDELLNAPIDAKVVDDFTGLTSPKGGGGGGFGVGTPF